MNKKQELSAGVNVTSTRGANNKKVSGFTVDFPYAAVEAPKPDVSSLLSKGTENDSFPINARDLHRFLGIGREFSNWIKDRIEKNGFREGEDYLPVKLGGKTPSGTKHKIEYHLTILMAKELSIFEGSNKGREAKLYFTEIERGLQKADVATHSNQPGSDFAEAYYKDFAPFIPTLEEDPYHLEYLNKKVLDTRVSIDSLLPEGLEENPFPVNARNLHSFLGSSRQFANWITDKIEKNGFEEGVEYYLTNLLKTTGGRPKIEYRLSISMAKELAMLEGNDKGREVRKYFIECERKLQAAKSIIAAPAPQTISLNDPIGVIEAFLQAHKQQAAVIQKQAAAINEVKDRIDKVESFVSGGSDYYTIRGYARLCRVPSNMLYCDTPIPHNYIKDDRTP